MKGQEIKTVLIPRTSFTYGDVLVNSKGEEFIFIDIVDGQFILEDVDTSSLIKYDPLRKSKLSFHPKFNPGFIAKKYQTS